MEKQVVDVRLTQMFRRAGDWGCFRACATTVIRCRVQPASDVPFKPPKATSTSVSMLLDDDEADRLKLVVCPEMVDVGHRTSAMRSRKHGIRTESRVLVVREHAGAV